MEKDQSFGKSEACCSAHDCTGMMPAAVSGDEQRNLDELEGIHEPAEKKACRCGKDRRQDCKKRQNENR